MFVQSSTVIRNSSMMSTRGDADWMQHNNNKRRMQQTSDTTKHFTVLTVVQKCGA